MESSGTHEPQKSRSDTQYYSVLQFFHFLFPVHSFELFILLAYYLLPVHVLYIAVVYWLAYQTPCIIMLCPGVQTRSLLVWGTCVWILSTQKWSKSWKFMRLWMTVIGREMQINIYIVFACRTQNPLDEKMEIFWNTDVFENYNRYLFCWLLFFVMLKIYIMAKIVFLAYPSARTSKWNYWHCMWQSFKVIYILNIA